MNIVYDHQIFQRQKYGGITRYYRELIPRIAKYARVSLSQGLHISEHDFGDVQFQGYFGFRRPLIPQTGPIFTALSDLYLEKYFMRKTDFNLYHQTYYKMLMPGFKGKRVVTVYDMIHEKFDNPFSKKDPTIYNKKIVCNHADGVICISESTKKDLIEYLNLDEAKIKVIYLANSLNKNNDLKRIVNDPYLLFVGHRGGYKNFDVLFKAYSNNRVISDNYRLVCFGGAAFDQAEEELFQKHRVTERLIHLAGADEMLANLYTYASVYIFPSLYEGFGLPTLEAMHLGCPVVLSDRSSIPEVAGTAGLYFNPESSEDLAEKLEMIISNYELRESLVAKGYEQEKKFSWDKCAEETLSFYQSL